MIEQKALNIHRFHRLMKASEEQWVLNISDVHFDSKNCDRKLLKKHLREAEEREALVLINGDWLDVMGCKHDPRSLPNDIRPEYNKAGGAYLDLVMEDSYEFLKKYNLDMLFTYGNHCTNIIKRQQIDPLKGIVKMLTNDRIHLGAYQGALIMHFQRPNSSAMYSSKWFYHHGAGGGAKRSKGILNADILVSQNSWADVITSGHDHNKWSLPYTVKTLCENNFTWKERRIDILRTGSYKKKAVDFGFAIEKDFNTPSLGGYWVKYKIHGGSDDRKLLRFIEEAR